MLPTTGRRTAHDQHAAPTPRGQRLPRSERRAQLLDAAQAVFVESGYHAAAMDEIADRAGVSKPVLYQHFPGKLDLYLALLDKHCETLETLVREALEVGGDNKERVSAPWRPTSSSSRSEGAAFRMVFESDLTSEPAGPPRLDAVDMNCAEAIAEVIAEDTGADDERALLLGSALAGMAQVAARHWLAQGGDVPEHEAAAMISALAWRGLGSFPKVGS